MSCLMSKAPRLLFVRMGLAVILAMLSMPFERRIGPARWRRWRKWVRRIGGVDALVAHVRAQRRQRATKG
jgi:hypothetical protein